MRKKYLLSVLLLSAACALPAHGRVFQYAFRVTWGDGFQEYQVTVPHVAFVENNVTLTGTTSDGKYVTVSGSVPTNILTFPDPTTGQPVYVTNYLVQRIKK